MIKLAGGKKRAWLFINQELKTRVSRKSWIKIRLQMNTKEGRKEQREGGREERKEGRRVSPGTQAERD